MKMLRIKRGNNTLEPIIGRHTHHGSPTWPEVFCIAEDACQEQLKAVVEWLLENNQATEAHLSDPPVDGEGVNKGWSGYRIFLGELLMRVDQVQSLRQEVGL